MLDSARPLQGPDMCAARCSAQHDLWSWAKGSAGLKRLGERFGYKSTAQSLATIHGAKKGNAWTGMDMQEGNN